MRCMTRNKQHFFYALYEKDEPIYDEYGNDTGERNVIYGNPIGTSANISAAKGEIDSRQFGENESYDKIIVMDNIFTKIDEHSVLWVDTLPCFDEKGNCETPHDYIVKKVARSLNSVSIAITKVDVNG